MCFGCGVRERDLSFATVFFLIFLSQSYLMAIGFGVVFCLVTEISTCVIYYLPIGCFGLRKLFFFMGHSVKRLQEGLNSFIIAAFEFFISMFALVYLFNVSVFRERDENIYSIDA